MRLLYITFPNRDMARKTAHALVNEKLVACVNILNNITSIYSWQGEIQEEQEVLMIAKTSDAMTGAVIQRTKELHSYDCPCVISVKIDDGNKDFLKWVETSVKLPY